MDIDITKTQNSRLATTDFSNLQFGNVFSDHMFYTDYQDHKWQQAHIVPFGEITFARCFDSWKVSIGVLP